MKQRTIAVYPIVRKIPESIFLSLLEEQLTPEHRLLVETFRAAQLRFGLLTKRKYAYFWTIHNNYLPVQELEYPETVKVPRPSERPVNNLELYPAKGK